MRLLKATNRVLRRFFPAYAYRLRRQTWDHKWSRVGFSPPWRITSYEIQEAVDQGWFPPGASLLDIGCGSGEIAAWLAERGYDVLGVDYSQAAISLARATYRDGRGRLAFQTVDICREPPGASRFNALLDRGCFHVIPRRRAAEYVRHVAAAARPGARFLLLYGTTRHLAKDGTDPEQMKQDQIRYVQTVFEPAFDIIRMADTIWKKRPGESPESFAPGIAFWMIRR